MASQTRVSSVLANRNVSHTVNDDPVKNEIRCRVRAIIADKLGVDESEVLEDAQFVRDLGADSLDVVELIMELEKDFGISISDEDAERMSTVCDAIDYIYSRVE